MINIKLISFANKESLNIYTFGFEEHLNNNSVFEISTSVKLRKEIICRPIPFNEFMELFNKLAIE